MEDVVRTELTGFPKTVDKLWWVYNSADIHTSISFGYVTLSVGKAIQSRWQKIAVNVSCRMLKLMFNLLIFNNIKINNNNNTLLMLVIIKNNVIYMYACIHPVVKLIIFVINLYIALIHVESVSKILVCQWRLCCSECHMMFVYIGCVYYNMQCQKNGKMARNNSR